MCLSSSALEELVSVEFSAGDKKQQIRRTMSMAATSVVRGVPGNSVGGVGPSVATLMRLWGPYLDVDYATAMAYVHTTHGHQPGVRIGRAGGDHNSSNNSTNSTSTSNTMQPSSVHAATHTTVGVCCPWHGTEPVGVHGNAGGSEYNGIAKASEVLNTSYSGPNGASKSSSSAFSKGYWEPRHRQAVLPSFSRVNRCNDVLCVASPALLQAHMDCCRIGCDSMLVFSMRWMELVIDTVLAAEADKYSTTGGVSSGSGRSTSLPEHLMYDLLGGLISLRTQCHMSDRHSHKIRGECKGSSACNICVERLRTVRKTCREYVARAEEYGVLMTRGVASGRVGRGGEHSLVSPDLTVTCRYIEMEIACGHVTEALKVTAKALRVVLAPSGGGGGVSSGRAPRGLHIGHRVASLAVRRGQWTL